MTDQRASGQQPRRRGKNPAHRGKPRRNVKAPGNAKDLVDPIWVQNSLEFLQFDDGFAQTFGLQCHLEIRQSEELGSRGVDWALLDNNGDSGEDEVEDEGEYYDDGDDDYYDGHDDGDYGGHDGGRNSGSDGEQEDAQAEAARRLDTLYRLLTARVRCGNGHRMRLALCDWGASPGGPTEVPLLISCDAGLHGWCPARCVFASSVGAGEPPELDLCAEAQDALVRGVPLCLSFDSTHVWKTPEPASHRGSPGRAAGAAGVAGGACAQIEKASGMADLAGCIETFRFALRLVSSAVRLASGAWAKDACVTEADGVYYVERPGMADFRQNASIDCEARPDSRTGQCRFLFVSLARALVGLVAASAGRRAEGGSKKCCQHHELAELVTQNAQELLMVYYWSSIRICLLLRQPYDGNEHGATTEDVVRLLTRHIEIWEDRETQHQRLQLLQQQCENPGSDSDEADAQSPVLSWDGETSARTNARESQPGFVEDMDAWLRTYIYPLRERTVPASYGPVRVAILDSGLTISEDDPHLDDPDQRRRVVAQHNFYRAAGEAAPSIGDTADKNGHGTHVARLVLRYAPLADIVVAKIADRKKISLTRANIREALEWAGQEADIIVLSWGFPEPVPALEDTLRDLARKRKLVFAAASNPGGFGTQTWPATMRDVFAVHACDRFADVPRRINPWPSRTQENFAAFGVGVPSYWKGEYVEVSGTSFATPVAAAVAANVLEYARHCGGQGLLREDTVRDLQRPRAIRDLFLDHMALQKGEGQYHPLKPWKAGLWDRAENHAEICRILEEVAR